MPMFPSVEAAEAATASWRRQNYYLSFPLSFSFSHEDVVFLPVLAAGESLGFHIYILYVSDYVSCYSYKYTASKLFVSRR
jgi:hypothetical protein